VATDDEELLTAYLDGVSELTPDERKRVELRLARDPDFKREADELRAVIEQTRASASAEAASEHDPDWSALERQIREAVGPTVPMPWYRRMRWLAPISTLATTAAIALVWLHHAPADHAQVTPDRDASVAFIAPAAPAHVEAAPAAKPAGSTTIYIDGQIIDVSNVDPEALINDGASDGTADASSSGLLPASDYGWIDQLDDKAMERAERWLARKKG
jgi:anti-sigma factor RsiW